MSKATDPEFDLFYDDDGCPRSKCWITENCEGLMHHAMLGSFCPKCRKEIDFDGSISHIDENNE